MKLQIGKYYGCRVSTARGGDGASNWVYAVVWYRRGPNRLGYIYPSLPANLAAVRICLAREA